MVYNIYSVTVTGKRPQDQGRPQEECYQERKCLDIHLLKPARVLAEMATAEIPGVQQVVGAHGDPDQGQ